MNAFDEDFELETDQQFLRHIAFLGVAGLTLDEVCGFVAIEGKVAALRANGGANL